MNEKISDRKLIFVYGTLLRGFSNHELITSDKTHRFVGDATIKGFKMADLGCYPAIYHTGNDDDLIEGEIFDISAEKFERIRMMEQGAGYKVSVYDRIFNLIGEGSLILFEMDKEQVERYNAKLIDYTDYRKYLSDKKQGGN